MFSKGCAALTVVLAALCLAAPKPVSADQRYFSHTYDWFTPSQGEKEIEFYWTQENGGEADAQLEFEYGVTNRWMVAPYLLMKRQHGGEFEVEGWKLEQRYRLGKFAYNRLLPALYFEVKKENGEPFELEGKFITSYLFGNGWVWSNNLIAEGKLEGGNAVEFGYATGISHPVTDRLRAGIEIFGNWTEDEHFIGPTFNYRFNPTTSLIATLGLNYIGADSGSVRLLFSKEFR